MLRSTLFFLLFAQAAFAQVDQEFVITPTLSPALIASVPFDFTSINEDTLDLENGYSVNDALDQQAGISTVRSGATGQQATLFVQGGDGEDLLVLIDGVKVNDTSSPNGKFDFSLIDPTNIKSIEVLKGPQSGLYGADAFSGVVNIITKLEDKTTTKVSLNGGAHSTYGVSASHNQKVDNTTYRIHTNYQKSDGISNLSIGSEKDGFEYKNIQLKLNHQKNGKEAAFQFEYLKKQIDLDQSNVDDPNYVEHSENMRSQIKLSHLLYNSFYKPVMTYSFSTLQRHDVNLADSSSSVSTDELYKSKRQHLQLTNQFFWNNSTQSLIGFSYINEDMNSNSVNDKNLDTLGVFAQQVVKYKGIDSTFNVRYDNSSYGNDFITYRLGLSRMFAQSFKIQASFSTATKNPTLYQLYSSFGNSALKEETQKGGNLALSYHWGHGKIKWNYFNYSLKNLIDYNLTTSKYYNNGEADRKGYEIDISHKFSHLTLSANYTYLIATLQDGSYQLRRPRHQVSLAATHRCDHMSFSVITNYIGTRAAYPTGSLPGFVKLDFRSKYNLSKKTSLSLQWNNILNHQYEMIKGYQTEGSALYGKLTYQF